MTKIGFFGVFESCSVFLVFCGLVRRDDGGWSIYDGWWVQGDFYRLDLNLEWNLFF